jgi:biopolymer transport protein ExbD
MDMAELMGEEGDGTELNLTPYLDIITTLVIFMIFTFQVVIEFRLIDVFVPQYGPKNASMEQEDPDKPTVTVTLFITDDGFKVVASTGIAPSEVPKKGDKYDYDALHETLVTWKDKLELGESIILIAGDKIEYQTVVETMDAIRNDGKHLLFPDVALATVSTGGGN